MDVRPSPIAGRWYSADAERLAQSIDGYLSAAGGEAPSGKIIGLVAPHAGHIYSGPVAAYAYRLVRQLPVEVVVILSPSHFHSDGPLMSSSHDAYRTPLGEVEIDRRALTALRAALGAAFNRAGSEVLVEIRRDREHAVEKEIIARRAAELDARSVYSGTIALPGVAGRSARTAWEPAGSLRTQRSQDA